MLAALILSAGLVANAKPTDKRGGNQNAHAVAFLGTIAKTTRSGTSTEGDSFAVGEDIYGPFEAGFSTQQNGILEALGCSSGNLGHVAGGIDTHTAEQMVAHQCDVALPRWEGSNYISLLDTCGGHTRDYHFHERMTCLYSATGAHSPKVGEATGGQPIYGKWEDADNQVLPELDACGGHWGRTPESPNVDVYHYHVQGSAPFTFGCLGPNDDDSLVTVAQCRAFYPDQCDGTLVDVTTPAGAKKYDLWCPCFDANGSNSGVNIAELAVFSSSKGRGGKKKGGRGKRAAKRGNKKGKDKEGRVQVCEEGSKPACPAEDTEMMKTSEGPVCVGEDEVETAVECVAKEEREERARLCEKGLRPSCEEGFEMTKLEDKSKVCVSTEDESVVADVVCIESKKGGKGGKGKGGESKGGKSKGDGTDSQKQKGGRGNGK